MSKESRRAAKNAARTGTTRPASTGPSGTPRAGRRERVRRAQQKTFFERYRSLLIGGVVIAVVAVVVGLVVTQTTRAAYTCTVEWDPAPTASPAAGATGRLGYPEDDMGRLHDVQRPQKYTFCPPASGNHYAQPQAPIVPRLYRPDDAVGPMSWIHNLEHGGFVVLYRGDGPGATTEGQQALRSFFDSFPPSPICQIAAGKVSPVIARFDQMKWPYAALVWGRVLPLDKWDPALVLQFYATESERLDSNGAFVTPPEPPCAAPSQSAAPSESAAPTVSAPASQAPSGSPAPSGSAAPSGSVAPSASPSSS